LSGIFSILKKIQSPAEKKSGFWAGRKGAELALIPASRYPFITRVAVFAPDAYCFQGLAFKNVSSWTYEGKSLPFIRLKNRWLFANMLSCFIKNEP
jgi:hypothetical protein